MSMVSGTVQAVSSKVNIFNTQHGPRYNLQFKMTDGVWYKYPFCKPDQAAPVVQGMMCNFDFTLEQNGQYTNNIVVKQSFQSVPGNDGYQSQQQPVQQQPNQQSQQPQQSYQQSQQQGGQNYQPNQQQSPQQPKKNSFNNPGMAVGMAMNCASRIMAAEGWPDGQNSLGRMEQLAKEILRGADYLVDLVEKGQLYDQINMPDSTPSSVPNNNPQPQQHVPQSQQIPLAQQVVQQPSCDGQQQYQPPEGFSDDVPPTTQQDFSGSGQPQ